MCKYVFCFSPTAAANAALLQDPNHDYIQSLYDKVDCRSSFADDEHPYPLFFTSSICYSMGPAVSTQVTMHEPTLLAYIRPLKYYHLFHVLTEDDDDLIWLEGVL